MQHDQLQLSQYRMERAKEEAEEQYNKAIEFVKCVEHFLSTISN